MTTANSEEKKAARDLACKELVREARVIELGRMGERGALDEIKDLMITCVKAHSELFDPKDFELPTAYGRFHNLIEGGEIPYGLYLSVTLPGKEASPHIHGLWGITVGISGCEVNHFWERTDDASAAGKASLKHISSIDVVAGTGMTLAGNEIHSTTTLGNEPSWMLHLYERPFAEFPSLLFFQPQRGTVRKLPSNTAKTIRG